MAAGDIYKKRLKATTASLGTGTADASTYLRGDGTWQTPAASSDVSNLENTLIMMAWDVYSEDRSFDDIYADDFTDATGIDGTVGTSTALSGNSTGIYDSANALFKSGIITGLTSDFTSSQLNCSAWSDINSVAITQTTSGDITSSTIYYAVSFDGGANYKVYKSGAWTIVAKNNGGTWQYNNAGTLTNASTNSLAGAMAQSTAQSAYQWTKANIEAMTDANWEESGGWSTSVNTIDWTYRLVNGTGYVADGTGNTSESYATADMTAADAPSPNVVSASTQYNTTYVPWKAFNQSNVDVNDCWASQSAQAMPQWLKFDFGSGNTKVINKYKWISRNVSGANSPKSWTLDGSNDNSNWTTLSTVSNISNISTGNTSSDWYRFSNSTPYRYYRINVTDFYNNAGEVYVTLGELLLVEAQTSATTPTFTKATFNYDTDHIPLDLRTNGWEASANDPTDGYVVLDVEPVDAITNNTDIKAYICIDNGSNYEQITLESTPFREIGAHDYIRGDISGIIARTDKTIRFKVTSHNSKSLKLHALGGGVKY